MKNLKNGWNPGTWVLIWEYSGTAILLIPTWQGLDVFQKNNSLDLSSLSIWKVQFLVGIYDIFDYSLGMKNKKYFKESH